MDLKDFEKEIGYEFKNKELLKTALKHISYAHEHKQESNDKSKVKRSMWREFI